MLAGKKTYIISALAGVVVFAQYMNWLTPEVAQQLLTLLGASGLATLRLGVANMKDGK